MWLSVDKSQPVDKTFLHDSQPLPLTLPPVPCSTRADVGGSTRTTSLDTVIQSSRWTLRTPKRRFSAPRAAVHAAYTVTPCNPVLENYCAGHRLEGRYVCAACCPPIPLQPLLGRRPSGMAVDLVGQRLSASLIQRLPAPCAAGILALNGAEKTVGRAVHVRTPAFMSCQAPHPLVLQRRRFPAVNRASWPGVRHGP